MQTAIMVTYIIIQSREKVIIHYDEAEIIIAFKIMYS